MKLGPILAVFLITLTVSLTISNLTQTRAQAQLDPDDLYTPPPNAQVDFINHTVKVLTHGSIIINDTVQISAIPGNTTEFSHFLIGFPHEFKYNLVYCAAFNASTQEELSIELDVGLGKQGYYVVNVVFPDRIVLTGEQKCRFTVVFVLTDVTTMTEVQVFEEPEPGQTPQNVTVDQASVKFPVYPSLVMNAQVCNVSFILQPDTTCNNPQDLSGFSKVQVGIYEVWTHTKLALSAFAYSISQFKIIPNPATSPGLSNFDVSEITMNIALTETRQFIVTSTTRFTNRHIYDLQTFYFRLPRGAAVIEMWDDVGNALYPALMNQTANFYSVVLKKVLKTNVPCTVTLVYSLPWDEYVTRSGWQDFDFSFNINFLEYTVGKMTVNIVLPENARLNRIEQPQVGIPFALEKSSFRDKAMLTFNNATPVNSYRISFGYQYSVFWASFRPTLWVSALMGVVAAAVLVWRSRKPTVTISVAPVSAKLLKNFVEAYERKNQLKAKLALLEDRVNKGRISRREYKINRRTIENTISSLEKELAGLKEKLRSAGARYAETVKQIEFAETELEEVAAGESRVKVRYSRGEVALDAYRKLLEDYAKRRERAETSIEGALMSLREGTV